MSNTTHESGHDRHHDPTTARTPDPTSEAHPGRTTRSALMRMPAAPIPSGLVARVARDSNGVASDAEHAVARATSSSGAPLPSTLMRKFESSLGVDLGGVRVHTGEVSATANDAVGARAYTLGQDIHFGAGQYDPSSAAGEHLLAHEVAHTVQQGGGASRMQFKLSVSAPGDSHEHEADTAASAMVAGQVASVSFGAGVSRTVQREPNSSLAKSPDATSTPSDKVNKAMMATFAKEVIALKHRLPHTEIRAANIAGKIEPHTAAAKTAYKVVTTTWTKAHDNIAEHLKVQGEKQAKKHEAIADAMKFVVGKAFALALGPVGAAFEEAGAIGVLATKQLDKLADISKEILVEQVILSPVPKLPALHEVDDASRDYADELSMVKDRVIGQLGNLLNLCAATLPALDVLERNFTALAKGTSTLDDTVVAPSVCQQAWFKMTGLDSLCRAADEKADDIVANCERTAHRASALAQTTVESAERQIWEKYKTSNPEVGELEDPASTNDVNADKDASVAPSAPKNKKLLQMIGMQYAIGSQVNKFAQASGKPGSEMIIVCSPGTIAGDKPLRAITRAPTAVIPTGALALVIDIDFGSSPEDATVVVEPAGKTLAPPAPTSADASVAPEQAAAGSGASAISSMKPASFTPAE